MNGDQQMPPKKRSKGSLTTQELLHIFVGSPGGDARASTLEALGDSRVDDPTVLPQTSLKPLKSLVDRLHEKWRAAKGSDRQKVLDTLVDISKYLGNSYTDSRSDSRDTVEEREDTVAMGGDGGASGSGEREDVEEALERSEKSRKRLSTRMEELERTCEERGKMIENHEREIWYLKGEVEKRDKVVQQLREKMKEKDTEIQRLSKYKGTTNQKEDVVRLTRDLHDCQLALSEQNDKVTVLGKQLTEWREIEVNKSGYYTEEINLLMMDLMVTGVADGMVGTVIEKCLTLSHARMNRVPSESTVRRCAQKVQALNYIQCAGLLKDLALKDLCLISDETPKKSLRLQGYLVCHRNPSGTMNYLSLGIVQVATKGAKESLDALVERLTTVAEFQDKRNWDEGFVQRVVGSVSSCMSDSASTQKLFNELFEHCHNSAMEYLRREEDDESGVDYARVEVNKFYCQLHIVANSVAVVEETFDGVAGKMEKDSEGKFMEVLKVVASHFSERGGAKFHEVSKWREFLKSEGYGNEMATFPSFMGNRFNIAFAISARAFHFREWLVRYIEKNGIDDAGLQGLAENLKNEMVVAQLQVGGLIDLLITGPLIRLSECVGNILDTCVYVRVMVEWMGEMIGDPEPFFRGEFPCLSILSDSQYDQIFNKERSLFKSLTKGPVNDKATEFARHTLLALKEYVETRFAEFMPGGKWSEKTDEERERLSSVPCNSRRVEAMFGMTDALFRRAPNMSVSRRNALIMAKMNKVMDWVKKLDERERLEVLGRAMSKGKGLEKASREEGEKVAEKVREEMERKAAQFRKKEKKSLKKKTDLTESVESMGGMWKNREEMDGRLRTYQRESARVKALETQIRFRQYVLTQSPPYKNAYSLRADGAQLEVPRLRSLLLVLMDATKTASTTDADEEREERGEVEEENLSGKAFTAHLSDEIGIVTGKFGEKGEVEKREGYRTKFWRNGEETDYFLSKNFIKYLQRKQKIIIV